MGVQHNPGTRMDGHDAALYGLTITSQKGAEEAMTLLQRKSK